MTASRFPAQQAVSTRAGGGPAPGWPVDDARFERRIVRLRNTSAIALGVVWLLVRREAPSWPVVRNAVLAGWITMPSLLAVSLRRPQLRFALVVPSCLVLLGMAAMCGLSSGQRVAQAGWILATAGVALGGLLGVWLWYRWLPVPRALTDPLAPGRLMLIVVHVALIVTGLGTVVMAR